MQRHSTGYQHPIALEFRCECRSLNGKLGQYRKVFIPVIFHIIIILYKTINVVYSFSRSQDCNILL